MSTQTHCRDFILSRVIKWLADCQNKQKISHHLITLGHHFGKKLAKFEGVEVCNCGHDNCQGTYDYTHTNAQGQKELTSCNDSKILPLTSLISNGELNNLYHAFKMFLI